MFKKDNLVLGLVLGLFAPALGLFLFKVNKFTEYSLSETISFMLQESGYRTLSVALSISLLLNAILFTLYINNNKDKTARGIFFTTLFYGLIILGIKTFY